MMQRTNPIPAPLATGSSRIAPSIVSLALLSLGLLSCQQEAEPAKGEKPVPVKVLEFGKDQGAMTLEFSGTLQENSMAPIAFQVSGRVTSVLVDNGDTVAKGQLLATLDSAMLVESSLLSQAKLRQAKDAYQRMKPLHDSGAVSEVKWVEMETGLAQAEASANMARQNLDDSRLLAPVRGIVVRKNLEVGQSAMPGISVLSLVDSRYLDAVFAVPETEVLHVRVGMPMQIVLPGQGEESLSGKVTEVAIQADAVSRSYPVRVRLDNQQGRMRMGMACHGEVVVGDSKGVSSQATIPMQAVLEKPNGDRFVYVLENNKAVERRVVIGGFLGKGLRILSGLKPGELVIVEGVHGITNGLTVQR